MTITFVCQACDDSFEFDYAHLAEETKGIKCPSCSKRLPPADVDEFVTSLDELLEQVAGLRKRFALSFEIDADDLPAPFDSDKRRARASDDDDDDDDSGDDDDEAGLDDELRDEDEDEDR